MLMEWVTYASVKSLLMLKGLFNDVSAYCSKTMPGYIRHVLWVSEVQNLCVAHYKGQEATTEISVLDSRKCTECYKKIKEM